MGMRIFQRSCLGVDLTSSGFRFALAEMKALLFHIVRGFEWKLDVEPSEIWSRTGGLLRTQRRGTNKIELPVVLTPFA